MVAHALHPTAAHIVPANAATGSVPSGWPHPALPLPTHTGRLEGIRSEAELKRRQVSVPASRVTMEIQVLCGLYRCLTVT